MNSEDFHIELQADLTVSDLARFRLSRRVGVDTETAGMNIFRDPLCLVQLCDAEGTVTLVKTNRWNEALLLKELFQDSGTQKIFHNAVFDCSVILLNLGVEVNNAYCTKIASQIIRTYSLEHGLLPVVKDLLGVELDKSHRSTDWNDNHLSNEQLCYAIRDVVYLIKAQEKLEEKIHSRGYLSTGITYDELNQRFQSYIPTIVHAQLNGWEFVFRDKGFVF